MSRAWLLLFCVRLFANDGSALANAAGGIQLKREARVSMEKERLTISPTLITVEYEFLNTTDSDITSEVAFPVPEYNIGYNFTAAPADLASWRLWVEGKELKYQTEVKALLKGKDYAEVLRGMSIDAPTYGRWHYEGGGKEVDDIQKLPKAKRAALIRLGLIGDDGTPAWSVRKTYHWEQTFPAHKVLHVRHEYQPQLGLEHLNAESLQRADKQYNAKLSDACVDPSLLKTLIAAAPNDNGFAEGYVEPRWVDYILTTANTWKTPIKDFELILQKPKAKGKERHYLSLCWDGKVEAAGPDEFRAKATDFVPKKELRVMFFQVGK
jgi:hypothetical protein